MLYFQIFVILLEAICGDSYSITFGNGLMTVKPQQVTYNLSLLKFQHIVSQSKK